MQCRYWIRSRDLNCESERYSLYKYWARFLYFFKEQPLNLVRYDLKTNKVISDVCLLQINVAAEEFTANMLFVFLQQEVLRGEDRCLFCMAGFLHWDAVLCCNSRDNLFHLWVPHLRWQRVEVSFTKNTNLFCWSFRCHRINRCYFYCYCFSFLPTVKKSVARKSEAKLSCARCVTRNVATGNSTQHATPHGWDILACTVAWFMF